MIPLRDNIPRRAVPRATLLLIASALCVYGYEMYLHFDAQALGPWLRAWGLVPREFLHGVENPRALVTPLTSIFLHAGHVHLLGNLLYLWIFGASIEGALGAPRFLIFYFVCGLAASMIHVASAPESLLPTVGASGAISGVLGAYLRLYPKGKLELFLIPVRVPALLFLLLWFGLQVASGLEAGGVHVSDLPAAWSQSGMQSAIAMRDVQAASAERGAALVAWWAHIGGFLAGFALANSMKLETSEPSTDRARKARSARRR